MENIHPNLKKEAFFANYGLMIFIISTVVPLVIVFIVLQATLPFDFIRTVSFFMGILVLSIFSTLVYLKVMKYFRLRINYASKALYAKPFKGIIQPEVLQSIWGMIFKIKDEEGKYDLVALKVQKYSLKKMHDQPVELFKGDKSGNVVVVKYNNKFMIGKLHNDKKAEVITHNYRKTRKIVLSVLVILIFVLIAAQVFHYFSVKADAEFAEETKHWPSVNGTVVSARIDEVQIKQGKTHVKGYKADVEYSYYLNGKEYVNNMIHLAYEAGTNFDYAAYYYKKYPTGSSPLVYYNPENLSFALLEPGHAEEILNEINEIYIVTGAISGLLLFTSIILLIVFKDMEKKAIKFFKDTEVIPQRHQGTEKHKEAGPY